VKSKSIILFVSSALVTLLFLAGSTGVTLINHNCPVCIDFYINSTILISPIEPENHCCEAADRHTVSNDNQTMENRYCNCKIESLKLKNYSPAVPVIVEIPADVPLKYYKPAIYSSVDLFILPPEVHNKHGGRFLITYNCQLIS